MSLVLGTYSAYHNGTWCYSNGHKLFSMPNVSSTTPGKRFDGTPEGEYHPSQVKKHPREKQENLFPDSSTGSINSSQSTDGRKSLKCSDSPDSKHPPPMIEGIDLITSENAKKLFKCDKHKYSSKANLERYRQLMISRGMDLTHGAPPTPHSEGSSRSSSSSSSSSGSSPTSSKGSSSAIGSDVSKPMPECAAGKMCRVPTELQLANSSHHCWGCNKKIHSALLCGSLMSDLIFNNPSVDGMSFNNGNIIEECNDNKTQAICFTCLGPLSIFFTGSVAAKFDFTPIFDISCPVILNICNFDSAHV